jgi:hypothetical protein
LHALTPPTGLAAFDPVSIVTGQAQVILERDPAAAAQAVALLRSLGIFISKRQVGAC